MLTFSNVEHLPRNRADISFWIKLEMVMNEITNYAVSGSTNIILVS